MVADDDLGVVTDDGTDFADALGPLTRHGVNPYPWYDIAEVADIEAMAAADPI